MIPLDISYITDCNLHYITNNVYSINNTQQSDNIDDNIYDDIPPLGDTDDEIPPLGDTDDEIPPLGDTDDEIDEYNIYNLLYSLD